MDRMAQMTEIRWHGRGGQGAKTAAYLLAEAVMGDDAYIQAFPEYGPERMGAPVRAFVRISKTPIRMHCPVLSPDIVVVLDPTLMKAVDVTEGVPEDAVFIINSTEGPAEVRQQLGINTGRVYTVPALKIAMETIKRPIPNTVMLGAFAKATGLLDVDALKERVRAQLGSKLRPDVIQGNMDAIDRAAQEVQEG
jgi:pyruvate ferredoxin oxidoreductase gamma subunit